MVKASSKWAQSRRKSQLVLHLSVLGVLVFLCFPQAPAVAQAATIGRIEITALADGNNVSVQCFAVATNTETSLVYILEPSNSVIAGEMPAGTYDVVVTFDAGRDASGTEETTMFSILRVTVLAGRVSRETVTLAAALYPGGFGGDIGQDDDGPGDKPWGDDTGDDNAYDDNAYDNSGNSGDHFDPPYGDHDKGGDREDYGLYDDEPEYVPVPNGDVILKWTVKYTARVTEDSRFRFGDTYAFAPGGTDTTSRDNIEIVFSGTYTWRVTGVTDSALDLEEVSGQLQWSGSGSGEINEIERRTVQCYKDKANFLQPYDKQVEYAKNSTWIYTVQEPMGVSPPVPFIYVNGWYMILFAQVHDLGVSLSGKTVYKQEGCEGTDTETIPIDSPAGPASGFCDLTISDAFNRDEFRDQLRGECDLGESGEPFTVSGHGTWNLDHSDTQTDPDGLGQARYESHGVVDISYTLSFVPREPVIPVVPLVPPEESQPDKSEQEGSGSHSDEPRWPVVPLVP